MNPTNTANTTKPSPRRRARTGRRHALTRFTALAVGMATVTWSAGRATAQATYTWSSSADGNWSTGANWSGGTAPPSLNTNTIVFGGGTAYAVTFDPTTPSPYILNSLQFNNSSTGGVTLSPAAGNANAIRFGAPSGGATSFVQNGAGPVDITNALTVNVNGATLSGAGTGDVSLSSLTFTGGNTLTLSDAANVSVAALANTSGAAKTVTNNISAAGKALTIGSINLAATAGNTLTLGGSGTTTVTGVISQSGSVSGNLTKADAGTVFLQGANTFTGTLQVNNGILDVSSLADSGAASNGTGAIKILNGANTSATLRYSGSAPVTLTSRPINIFATGPTAGSAVIDNSGSAALTLGDVTQTGGNTPAKMLVLQGSYAGSANAVAGVISDGTGTLGLTKSGAGTWLLAGDNNYSGTTTITGGTLKLAPAAGSAEPSNNIPNSPLISIGAGAALDVSAIPGGFVPAANQMIKGSGSVIGPLSIAAGATLAPGNSAGSLASAAQTWAAGGQYVFEVADASGDPRAAAGANWDKLSINGPLTLTATADSPFLLKVASLAGAAPGAAANFDPSQNYTWTIASASGGISGFSPADFVIDPSGFANATDGGQFSLTTSGNDLLLNFTAAPEPASAGLLATGAAGLLLRRHRTAGRLGCEERIRR